MIRVPAVAGQFYEQKKENLIRDIEACFLGNLGPGKLPMSGTERTGQIIGLVCPHAGFVYSGSAAAWAYYALDYDGIPDIAIILGPNHYGIGPTAAISPDDSWATPLGNIEIDSKVAHTILESSKYASFDEAAHAREHSIEVQLPFLQYIGANNLRVVPISITHLSKDNALLLVEDLGSAIASAISGKSAVIIASTDFTHYENHDVATARDALAIEKILELDATSLIEIVYSRGITMCGVIGTAVMLDACKRLGARSAQKLTYYTSGDITGDTSQVVGYGALKVNR